MITVSLCYIAFNQTGVAQHFPRCSERLARNKFLITVQLCATGRFFGAVRRWPDNDSRCLFIYYKTGYRRTAILFYQPLGHGHRTPLFISYSCAVPWSRIRGVQVYLVLHSTSSGQQTAVGSTRTIDRAASSDARWRVPDWAIAACWDIQANRRFMQVCGDCSGLTFDIDLYCAGSSTRSLLSFRRKHHAVFSGYLSPKIKE